MGPCRLAATLGLAVLGPACVGDIGDPVGRIQGGGGVAGLCREDPDPGRVTLHRLNRAEYDNTMRDLLGVDLKLARDFPSDDSGYGFDNIADVLAVAPLLVEKYHNAAQQLVDAALAGDSPAGGGPVDTRYEAEDVGGDVGVSTGDGWNLYSTGAITQVVDLPATGEYVFSANGYGEQAGPDLVQMTFRLDGQLIQSFEVEVVQGNPQTYEIRVPADEGTHSFAVAFANDYYDPGAGEDRNLIVDWIAVRGPIDAAVAEPTPTRDRIVTCDPAVLGEEPCGRQILSQFARRAWRRPVEDAEVDRLLQFLDLAREEGDGFEEGIQLALEAVLLSPYFVFRVELDPDPDAPDKHALTDHELASRLSYFLWSSMPDDELFAAADAGALADPVEVESQVRRMLDDDRAGALVDNFAGQWLYLRNLASAQPDYTLFPDWDEDLRAAMDAETRMFFQALLDEDLSLQDLLRSDFTFANERLARHYGLEGVTGSELQRVMLAGGQRGGLLAQGSWLTVTSHANRTSPVKRGKWVLSNLLCQEPAPPPANVPALEEPVDPTESLRERMERHRSDPVCAGCHAVMDPIGFGLENFDAIGAWRVEDAGFPIDATGALPDGRAFDGGAELSTMLAAEPDLGRCAASRVFTYALGRGEEPEDECDLEAIAAELTNRGGSLRELMVLVATSDAFRMRRGEVDDDPGESPTGDGGGP